MAGLGAWTRCWLASDALPGREPQSRRTASARLQELIESLALRGELRLTSDQLAREVSLSPSRFYQRWLRLRRALANARAGQSLTDAATSAGFADGAHLTRTMRRHFGVAPSDVLGALRG